MIQTSKEKSAMLDSLNRPRKRITLFDLPLARFVIKNKNSSILFSRHGKTRNFCTRDSKLYYTQEELSRVRRGEEIFRVTSWMDSLASRHYARIHYFDPSLIYSRKKDDPIYERIEERYSSLKNYISDLVTNSVQGVSMTRMWNVSVVCSLIFGMLLMTMIYRYLGQGVNAESQETASASTSQVLAAETVQTDTPTDTEMQLAEKILEKEQAQDNEDNLTQSDFEKKLTEMVKGYPIEKMVPYIAKKDKLVAAFMISIAKKESGWGEHVPLYQGEDCYNYWGFRAQRDKMGTGGHTCFDSPQDAVDSVAKRLQSIISNEKITTPKGMVVVWKCGYDCSWDDPEAVNKWVSDVSGYFDDVNSLEK
jgi:flagellum-specific peptidoglycan hydrolase FlgJ